jgi:FAD synthase
LADVPLVNGIYWGYAQVENGPFFKGNTKRSFEVHFMTELEDFYGSTVRGVVVGFIVTLNNSFKEDECVYALLGGFALRQLAL